MKTYKINRCGYNVWRVNDMKIPVFIHRNRLIFRSEMESNYLENNCEGLNYNALVMFWVVRPLLFKILKTQFINEERILNTIRNKKLREIV